MPDRSFELHGTLMLELGADGPLLASRADAIELITAAWRHQAKLVLLPAARLSEEFFRLDSGLAGEFMQKFVNYGMRLAIVGDISRHLAASPALRDLVRECNSGRQVWFLNDASELEQQFLQRPQ